MGAGLHRVTVSLTSEELARLDHYRERVRLPRGTALRIAAMETIPEAPAARSGEADTPEVPAGQPKPADPISESNVDQPKEDIDVRIARLMREAGMPEKEDIDTRIARLKREAEEFGNRR